jgi:hypothetical protein
MAKFPGPYVSDCNANDPLMERVPFPTTGIGARNSGLPSGMSNSMNIDHVGGSTSGSLTRRQS